MPGKKLSKEEQLDQQFLLQEIIHGDYKAFTRVYEMHIVPLTNYAFRFTDNIQTVEDTIHDIFIWLWNNRTKLQISYSIKAYLFKCVRTTLIRHTEKYNRVILFGETHESNPPDFFISGEEKYIALETDFHLKEKIASSLSLLTSKQKEVVYLRFYQSLSFDEIALNMNLSTKACYKLMGRAIAELKKSFNKSWQYNILFFLFFLNFMG